MSIVENGVWRDGTLVSDDGSVYAHEFRRPSLARLVRRKVPILVSGEPDAVRASEISIYVSGRYRRRVCGFSVYWHSHSDVIYALTGITYCVRIDVECGRVLSDGTCEIYAEPTVCVVRFLDGRAGIAEASQARAPVVWSKSVRIDLVRRPSSSSDDSLVRSPGPNSIGFPFIGRDASTRFAPVARSLREVRGLVLDTWALDCDTEIFIEKISVTYRCLLSVDSGRWPVVGERAILLERFRRLAGEKKLPMLDGSGLVNLFLANACLYGLGEEGIAEELIGILCARGISPDPDFDLHNQTLANACQLAFLLNCIGENRARLPVSDERLDNEDVCVALSRRFYEGAVDLDVNIIASAATVIRAFSQTRSVEAAARTAIALTPLNASLTKVSVVRILRL